MFRDQPHIGGDDLPGLVDDQFQDVRARRTGQEHAGDLAAGPLPAFAQPGLLVQPGVLDGHSGGHRQRRQDGLVLHVELPGAALLGEVEVSEHLVAHPDRHAEEGVHRRMVGREAVRRRMLRQLRQPQWHRVPDQFSEEPVPAGQCPDLRVPLFADADGQELGQLLVTADHAQRPVLGVHQHHRGLDDAAQHLRQVEFPADREDGLQQAVQAVPGPAHRVDAHLQLAQQFVEPQFGHMLLKTAAIVPAHDFLRPTQQTRRLEPVPLSSPYCPGVSASPSIGPKTGWHPGGADRSFKHNTGSRTAPSLPAPTPRSHTPVRRRRATVRTPIHAPTTQTATAVAASCRTTVALPSAAPATTLTTLIRPRPQGPVPRTVTGCPDGSQPLDEATAGASSMRTARPAGRRTRRSRRTQRPGSPHGSAPL